MLVPRPLCRHLHICSPRGTSSQRKSVIASQQQPLSLLMNLPLVGCFCPSGSTSKMILKLAGGRVPGQAGVGPHVLSKAAQLPHSMVGQDGREVVFASLAYFNSIPDRVALTVEIYFPEFWALASLRYRCCHSALGEGVPAPGVPPHVAECLHVSLHCLVRPLIQTPLSDSIPSSNAPPLLTATLRSGLDHVDLGQGIIQVSKGC